MTLNPTRLATLLCAVTLAASPILAQSDTKATFVKHLKTSRDFSLKVAGQMPESTYDFKLTPPQMSFADQMVHLSGSLDFFLSSISGEKPKNGKPASMKKSDVIAFMTKSFDDAVDRVLKLSPEVFSKTYKGEEGQMTGLEILMMMMDHTTHHRASAEMYLRAKGITPAEYTF
jgi:uncharacterized damage-inducible protein DinB